MKRPTLLSDDALWRVAEAKRGYPTSLSMAGAAAMHVREIYEAARSKDAELIQQLVDALEQEASCDDIRFGRTSMALKAAKAAGFTPSNP